MLEGKRQKQIAAVLIEELNQIFQKLNLNMLNGGMVSISNIKVTPDLLEARVYLSFFKVENQKETLKQIIDRNWEIKKELSPRIRHQVRRIPTLEYYLDDTLEYVDKMEQLFKDIKKQDEEIKSDHPEPSTD